MSPSRRLGDWGEAAVNLLSPGATDDADIEWMIPDTSATDAVARAPVEITREPNSTAAECATPASFRLPLSLVAPEIMSGEVVARFAANGCAAVTASPGRVAFAFDPMAALDDLLFERYVDARRPITARLPFHYHVVPGRWRFAAYRYLAKRSEDPSATFPAWPSDPAADALRDLVADALALASGRAPRALPSPWPDGKRFAMILSHDLDTPDSESGARAMAEVEHALGVRSCWAIVGRLFPWLRRLAEDLYAEGHEIAVHGWNHDTRLSYLPPDQIEKRLDACAPFVAEFGVTGFRPPALLTSAALDAAIERRYAWSCGAIDTDVGSVVAARRGVTTVFPFLKGGLVEIPVTLPLDDRLMVMGLGGDRFVRAILEKVDIVAARGGVAHLVNHPEPHLSGRPEGVAAYRAVLLALRSRNDLWFARPSDVATLWRGLRCVGGAGLL